MEIDKDNQVKYEHPIMYYSKEKEYVEIIGVVIDSQLYAVDLKTTMDDFPPMNTVKDKKSIKVIFKGFFNTAVRMTDINDVDELTPEQRETLKVLYGNLK